MASHDHDKREADVAQLPTSADVEAIKAALTAVEGVTNVTISVVMNITTHVPRFDVQRLVYKAEANIMKAHPHLRFNFSTLINKVATDGD